MYNISAYLVSPSIVLDALAMLNVLYIGLSRHLRGNWSNRFKRGHGKANKNDRFPVV